jgi:hypothetical protein
MAENTIKNRKQNHDVKGVLRAKKASKKAQAEERKVAHDTLTNQQKIALLDKKFGPGLGAIKERARLNAPPPAKKEEPKKAEESK